MSRLPVVRRMRSNACSTDGGETRYQPVTARYHLVSYTPLLYFIIVIRMEAPMAAHGKNIEGMLLLECYSSILLC
ncbi:hypothetical protein BDZ45DRAFT_456723 [Acephala macrosclerotiorum]|nr:hypothetical protein BDZ45DRAFT_456723 [Acephala macrosclerotiorum]